MFWSQGQSFLAVICGLCWYAEHLAQCLTWARYSRRYLLNLSVEMLIPTPPPGSVLPFPELRNQSLESEQDMRDRHDYVDLIDVPDSYNGPRLQFPLTCTDIDLLLEAFKEQQVSVSRCCLDSCT